MRNNAQPTSRNGWCAHAKSLSLTCKQWSLDRLFGSCSNILVSYSRQIHLLFSAGAICYPTCVFLRLYFKYCERPVLSACYLLADLQHIPGCSLYLVITARPLHFLFIDPLWLYYRPTPGVVDYSELFHFFLNRRLEFYNSGTFISIYMGCCCSTFRSLWFYKEISKPDRTISQPDWTCLI